MYFDFFYKFFFFVQEWLTTEDLYGVTQHAQNKKSGKSRFLLLCHCPLTYDFDHQTCL